jgi:hypothetical protein
LDKPGDPKVKVLPRAVRFTSGGLADSVSFPNTKTPGAGKTFENFFEFTLPTAEYVTASMSISGPLRGRFRPARGS